MLLVVGFSGLAILHLQPFTHSAINCSVVLHSKEGADAVGAGGGVGMKIVGAVGAGGSVGMTIVGAVGAMGDVFSMSLDFCSLGCCCIIGLICSTIGAGA